MSLDEVIAFCEEKENTSTEEKAQYAEIKRWLIICKFEILRRVGERDFMQPYCGQTSIAGYIRDRQKESCYDISTSQDYKRYKEAIFLDSIQHKQ